MRINSVEPITVNEAVVGWSVQGYNASPTYTGYLAMGVVCFRLDA